MIFLAKPYVRFVSSSPKALYTIYVLAPTVLFSSVAAARRSLAEGYMNMIPTSVSQLIEALFKVVFGLLFAKLSLNYLYQMYIDNSAVLGILCSSQEEALSVIYPLTSAAAMGGVTVGAFFSMVYTDVYVNIKYNSHKLDNGYKTSDSVREIVSFSAPIIISTVIQSASSFIDNACVQYFLSNCNAAELKEKYSTCLEISGARDEDLITYVYGLFSAALDFKNLIPGFTMALGVAAVPAVSAAFEADDCERLSNLSNSIFKYTSVIGLGGGFYLSLVAEYILNILYSSSNSDIVQGCCSLVRCFGYTVVFYSLSGTAVYAVQAIGCARKSIPSFIISAGIRVVINYFLVSNAKYNIFGAVISGAAGYLIILVSNLYIYQKYSNIKYKISLLVFKPLLCTFLAYMLSEIMFKNMLVTNNMYIDFIILSALYLAIFTVSIVLSNTIGFSELKSFRNYKNLA